MASEKGSSYYKVQSSAFSAGYMFSDGLAHKIIPKVCSDFLQIAMPLFDVRFVSNKVNTFIAYFSYCRF